MPKVNRQTILLMEKSNIEIRTLAEMPVAGEGRTISGYAIVWGVESRVLWDFDGDFVEIIERGAVDEALIARSDVKALFNHIESNLLARSVNGEGTLKLSVDERGLRFEFEAPNTTLGNDVLELVKRGDLRGCSFAFRTDAANVEYTHRGDIRVRTVKKLLGLYDVSVVVEPAYTQTSVDARSWGAGEEQKPEERTISAELAQLRAELRRSVL